MAKRGTPLSIFAVLLVLLALSNFMKPFSHDPSNVFIFLGSRTTGAAQAILAMVFGFYLLVYALGIWRMRRWVLPIAYGYAGWVILNTFLFAAKNRPTPLVLGIADLAAGVGLSSGGAILLRGRKAQLM